MNKRLSSIASMLMVAAIGPTSFQHPTLQSVQTRTLATQGPWMVYMTTDDPGNTNKLWAANQDGSAPTELVKDTTIGGFSAAPKGGYIAYISAEFPPGGVELLKMTLNVLHLPDRKITLITPLTNATTEPDSVARSYIAEAIGDMQWSPDGQTLAFTGAQGSSTSSDLYSYSLATKKVTQLSSGDSQAVSPNWSPDGKYIVHFGVDNFGSGAGKVMAGAWAAKADGSGVISLFQPKPGDGGFEFVGWTGPSNFITDSWTVECGNGDLRTVDIRTKQTTVLYSGFFNSVAWSPTAQTLLLEIGDYSGDTSCPAADPPGLYILTPASSKPHLAAPINKQAFAYQVQWSPAVNRFFVDGADGKGSPIGIISIQPDGTSDGPYATPTMPSISPDGKNLAWIVDGTLNISGAQNFQPVKVASGVGLVEWLP